MIIFLILTRMCLVFQNCVVDVGLRVLKNHFKDAFFKIYCLLLLKTGTTVKIQ